MLKFYFPILAGIWNCSNMEETFFTKIMKFPKFLFKNNPLSIWSGELYIKNVWNLSDSLYTYFWVLNLDHFGIFSKILQSSWKKNLFKYYMFLRRACKTSFSGKTSLEQFKIGIFQDCSILMVVGSSSWLLASAMLFYPFGEPQKSIISSKVCVAWAANMYQ